MQISTPLDNPFRKKITKIKIKDRTHKKTKKLKTLTIRQQILELTESFGLGILVSISDLSPNQFWYDTTIQTCQPHIFEKVCSGRKKPCIIVLFINFFLYICTLSDSVSDFVQNSSLEVNVIYRINSGTFIMIFLHILNSKSKKKGDIKLDFVFMLISSQFPVGFESLLQKIRFQPRSESSLRFRVWFRRYVWVSDISNRLYC
jgi:hypothetical protein